VRVCVCVRAYALRGVLYVLGPRPPGVSSNNYMCMSWT